MRVVNKLLLLLLIVTQQSNSSVAQDLYDLLPDVPEGWHTLTDNKIYNPESLYDYINGGAELYLSYGMKEVISRIIAQEDNEIRIEIFDMIESRNAFGVFTNTRLKDEQQYGQGSQYFPGVQIFWKGRYYVAITANDENDAIIKVIRQIASSIDEKIREKGDIPEIIGYLPQEGLQPDGYLYFHHYIWLNAQYYIADDNFLNIDNSVFAVLGKYYSKENRAYLLLVKYPEKSIADEAHTAFKDKFLYDSQEIVIEVEDGTWLGGEVHNKLLICVFNAKSREDATTLIEQTKTIHNTPKP